MSSDARSIYVADDEPDVRAMIDFALTRAGYVVSSFADGFSLLAAFSAHRPACVLLDVRMPKLSGLEVLARLNPDHTRTAVVMMSGNATVPLAIQAVKAGAFDFVTKPFHINSLLDTIAQAIRELQEPIAAAPANDPEIVAHLTIRERSVLSEISRGKSSKEIGRALQISHRTVEVYRSRLLDKFSAKNSAELVQIAGRAGLT